jgi:LysM repeat protein
MRSPRMTGLLIAGLIVVALSLGACTRSASTPVPTPGGKGTTPGALTGQQATMEAVRSALLTQTAQAVGGTPGKTGTPAAQGTPLAPLGTPTQRTTSTTPIASVVVAVTPTTCGTASYTVLTGEWVYSIARKFNVDPNDIISLNGLAAPYALTPGQSLKIPSTCTSTMPTSTPAGPTITPGGPTLTPGAGKTYVVQSGEWVYSIARKFGVDPQAIIDANHLSAPYTLSVGQTLIIP